MRRHVARLAAWGMFLLAVGGWFVARAAAENQAERARAASEAVARALRAEIEGRNSIREALLESALEKSPAHAAAHWHSGQVRAENRWVKYDDVPAMASQDERLALYRRVRSEHPPTVEGQMALAAWCAKRKLPDQERAHLANVLQINPEHAEARRLLGYRYVDGVWLTPQEVSQAQARSAAAVAALRKWQPELAEIRAALAEGKAKQREAAAARLEAIQDPAAVPAIELVFCGRDEATAQQGIRKLAGMTANEASVALARQAVFSPWAAVRETAVRALKPRRFESFVPVLLSGMSSPIRSRVDLFQEPTGRLVYRHAFFREGHEHNELAMLDTMYSHVLMNDAQVTVGPKPALQPGFRMTSTTTTTVDNLQRLSDQADARALARADAAFKAQAREAAVAQQNAAIDELNRRICDVLRAATGEKLPADAERWWNWWIDYHEVYVPGYKPTKTGYHRDVQVLATPSRVESETSFSQAAPVPRRHSCLAAGTPVWTENGPVPIDKIEVGDRVLAQHPETGELAYKPVLATTVREGAQLVRLDLLDDSIRTSSGHPFWIAGKGWVKAREIRPGAHFHGAAGTTPLRQTAPAGAEPVYNLIVADFHTYFVGRAMVYSHDITSRQPTNKLVPGLAEP